MKPIYYFYILSIMATAISGCVSGQATVAPTPTQTLPPSPSPIPPTFTPTFLPTQTATLTPPATLEPEQAKETIQTLLRESVDCDAPCFWGITPGKTTLNEAKSIFRHLGLQIESTTYQGKSFYGITYDFDSGLSITVTLTVFANLVENLRVDVNPETQKTSVPRAWSAYSPETLIKRYGTPSKVVFFVGRGPSSSYIMDIYFEQLDLIVEYYSFEIGAELQVCPLINQLYSVHIWMGKNPQYPPPSDLVPLEKATSMTIEEFSGLMEGDPNKACFNLKEEMFP